MASTKHLRTNIHWPDRFHGYWLRACDPLMLHCYRCNKAGVPIKNALCDSCRSDTKKLTVTLDAIVMVLLAVFLVVQ